MPILCDTSQIRRKLRNFPKQTFPKLIVIPLSPNSGFPVDLISSKARLRKIEANSDFVDYPVALISDWNGIAGKSIAHALASCEFSLLINGPEDEVFEMQAEDYPGRILAMPFEYSSEEAVEFMLSAALDIFGHVDVLVNNIYHWADAKFNDLTAKHWNDTYQNNVIGSFNVCRATARLMEALGYGKIINVTSTSAITGAHTALAASCAGVHSLTKSIAKELAPHIRCNTVACGLVEEDWVIEAGDDLKQSLIKGIPLRRLCQPEDVADVVAYLASGADFMTGQMVVIDGGESLP